MRLIRLVMFFSMGFAVALIAAAVPPLPFAPDLVVASDGSGDFRSIHEAVQSIPRTNRERTIILVKSGVYTEQVRVDAPCITLRGESRTGTRLQFSRANTDRTPGLGQGVLNLSATAHDFVLENFTVINTHGQLGVHAFTIFGLADRTVLLDSDVFSHGNDTISHWRGRAENQAAVDSSLADGTNSAWREGGRYYHARLNVRGSVDAHSPRAPSAEQITAAWTFGNSWDPERKDGPRIVLLRHQAQPDRLILTFSERVTVRGKPILAFSNGDAAELLEGSGTHTLVFSSPNAAFSGTVPRLQLNGGAIYSTEAGDRIRLAALTLP